MDTSAATNVDGSEGGKEEDNKKYGDWKLGRTRICDTAGYRGTVLFVGPVLTNEATDRATKKKPTIYVGIEWDDVNRGKHNGSIACAQTGRMISYFQTTHPTSGSFVPIHKVQRGVCLTPALLYSKYVPIDSEECIAPNNIIPNAYVRTSKPTSQKPIYFLGEQQIRPYQQIFDTIQTLSLRCYRISSMQVPEMIQWVQERRNRGDEYRNAISELDLAGNLLCDWQSLIDVLSIFPTLQRLSLAANRLCDINPSFTTTQHLQLQHLNVNGTHISDINTVLEIGKRFPNLRELILANNNVLRSSIPYHVESAAAHDHTISSATLALDVAFQLAQVFPNLTYLDCSNCTLELHHNVHGDSVLVRFSTNHDNAMVLIWSKLSKLQNLSLDDNPQLSAFRYPHDETSSAPMCTVYFPSLQHLQFANTKVTHWNDVVTTWQQHLPSLRSLRFRQCPLVLSLSKANVRHRLIAECPHLVLINATQVTEPERREAARWVFRLGLQERHMQYDYWMAQYPGLAAVQSSSGNSSPTSTLFPDAVDFTTYQMPVMTTQFSIVEVSIRSMAAASCTMAPWVRRLPTQLIVGKLKALCARHFGVDIERQRLVFRQDATSLPQEMDCNDHTLHYFGVPEGAEILMHEIDD
jgi:tubulin-specific chaperone E